MAHTNMRFCCACAVSVSEYIDLAVRRHGDIIDEKAVNSFLLANVPQFLTSLGECMKEGSQTNHLAARRFQKTFDDVSIPGYMKDAILYLDSAGYQIQKGYVAREHLPAYSVDYHRLLLENADKIGYAFALDLAPGTTVSVFSSAREIYELNKASYETAAALPAELRKKVLAVMHFRGPRLYAAFRKLLFGDGLAGSFEHFAVGGLAVARNTGKNLPCFPYVIPLTDILLHAKARAMEGFHFHILGSAERHDILVHCLVERHVRKMHGIDLQITHDATSAFKMPIKNRAVWLPSPEARALREVSIKSNHIYLVDPGHGSRVDLVYRGINDALLPHGLGPFNEPEHRFYKGFSATTLGNFLPLMLMLNVYAQLDDWCEQTSDRLYPYYEAGQINDFERGVATALVRLDARDTMDAANGIARAMTRSLDMLSSLDLDLCTHLVKRHLTAHEHASLQNTPILF